MLYFVKIYDYFRQKVISDTQNQDQVKKNRE